MINEFKHAPVNGYFRSKAYSLSVEKCRSLTSEDINTWIVWGGTFHTPEFTYLIDLAQKLADAHYHSEQWRAQASEFLKDHGQKVYEALEHMNHDSSGMYLPALQAFEKIFKK